MSKGLKIYACSGIGSADNSYGYWTDGTKSVSNTQSVNNLLAKINWEYAKVVNLDLTDEEIMRYLDNIDLYCVCMYYAREYSDNSFELHHVGQVISDLVINRNLFESDILTDEGRGEHLDDLFDMVDKAMDSSVQENAEFMKWWKENVEDLNQVGLSQQQQTNVTKSLMGDMVGAADYGDADLNKYLNDAGEYFLYTYFTAEQLKKLPPQFRRKAQGQKNLHQYCSQLYNKVNGNVESMDKIIEAGIISTLGYTPKEATQKIYDQYVKEGRIGAMGADDIIAIISAIGTVLGIVYNIVSQICKAVVDSKVAESEAINEEAIKGFTPNTSDYPSDWNKSESSNTMLYVGAALLAVLLLFRK